jgi:1-acyl-sn-glycerol-3-phosphate acyltransferase
MGVVLGAAGLASTELGAVLLYRDRSVPVVPIATVGAHHVLFSLSRAF